MWGPRGVGFVLVDFPTSSAHPREKRAVARTRAASRVEAGGRAPGHPLSRPMRVAGKGMVLNPGRYVELWDLSSTNPILPKGRGLLHSQKRHLVSRREDSCAVIIDHAGCSRLPSSRAAASRILVSQARAHALTNRRGRNGADIGTGARCGVC